MKALIQFILPTAKAVFGVIGFIVTITVSSLVGINQIAKTQAEIVEERIVAVRDADFKHINGRFNNIDGKLDKILKLVKE